MEFISSVLVEMRCAIEYLNFFDANLSSFLLRLIRYLGHYSTFVKRSIMSAEQLNILA